MRLLAIAVVAIMVSSAFVMISPGAPKKALLPEDEKSADVSANGGTRKVEYTISNVGEAFIKPANYNLLGRHQSPGLSAWWTEREAVWNDTIIHNSYPYVIAYSPYSDNLMNPAPPMASWSTHSFYRLTMNAENITGLATGADKDPWIIPIMGNAALDGGWVNMSLYFTYLGAQEFADIEDGIHYANSFYGVSGAALANWTSLWRTYVSDGWFSELQGHFDFSRRAAAKFLGLTGAGALADQFTARGPENLAAKWVQEWVNDGDADMPLDIYAAYDYSILTGNGPIYIKLTLDAANSTTDKLAFWFWSHSWGSEVLMVRYLEKVGILKNLEPWMEDWYLNGTLAPASGDIKSRMTAVYHLTAWRDTDPNSYLSPAWLLEPQHIDYTADLITNVWISEFDKYYWSYYDRNYKPTRICWTPGQAMYGKEVHYWQTPMNWNLAADETLVVKLPTVTSWGIEPYFSSNFSKPGLAAGEMLANGVSGEWVLGHGYPATLYSPTYYNAATKTLTLPSGSTWASMPNHNAAYPTVWEQGSPTILMDISRVSHYKLTLPAGPINSGVSYTLTVTPQDLANVNTLSNQSVQLPAVSGVTYGSSSHKFGWGEATWTTSVIFASPGTYNLVSQDAYFYLDVVDTYSFTVSPPSLFTLALQPGWNFVTIPLVGGPYKASNIGLQRLDVVAQYNSGTGTYDKTYIVGVSPPSLDITFLPSTGYWISTTYWQNISTLVGTAPSGTQTKTYTLTPTATTGWLNFGLFSLKTTWKASNIPAMCSGGTVSTVAWYNAATKSYKTYIAGVPPSDYTIPVGQAVWVYVTNVPAGGTITFTYTA